MNTAGSTPVRVAGEARGPRSAGRWGRLGRIVVLIGAPAVLVGSAWLGARQVQAGRARAVEREQLATAAALDRRSREDQIRVWNVALDTDPHSALALAQLAALHVQKARESGDESHYAVAEDMARRSLTLRTHRNAKTYVVLASVLLAQHRFSDARTAAASALALEPEVAQYRALLAEIDMELGDYDAAARGFSGLAPYRTHLSIGPRLARWAEVSGHPEYARELLQALVAEAEQRRDLPREQLAWFHYRLGDHYRRLGSSRRARASLERALVVNPGDYRAHQALAQLDLAVGDTRDAAKHSRAAIAVSRTPETLLMLANVLRESDDPEGAKAIEREVASVIGPEGGSFERAWHAYRLEWDDRAPAELVPLLEREARERRDAQGFDLLAWAYYRSGRLAEAQAASSAALRTTGSDAMAWYHAGMIQYASGDVGLARVSLRKAMSLNPAFHSRHSRSARAVLAAIDGKRPSN
ncbi:MAG: tetratricopeptide repeat protein [Gemmatimonadaceae bacterium]